jgi:hypothetical protein
VITERLCTKCGERFPHTFFDSKGGDTYRSICRGCIRRSADAEKRKDRWRDKMHATLRGHAQRLTKIGTHGLITPSQLASEYEWDVDRMAHDAKHVYENGCPNCGEPFRDMGHGLHDLTLDITDRTARPVYGANTRWLCMTCNRSKGIRSVSEMAELKMCWNRWLNRQQILGCDPWAGTMFADDSAA